MPVSAKGRALEAGIIDPGYRRSGVRIFISQAGKISRVPSSSCAEYKVDRLGDAGRIAEGADIRRQGPHFFFGNALRTTRSTLL
jgi:hypothetical protein